MKRIVITGIGGVGGYFGGMLARTYATNREVEVYFVARGKHGLEIARSGLEVETPKGSFRVRPEGVVEQPESDCGAGQPRTAAHADVVHDIMGSCSCPTLRAPSH